MELFIEALYKGLSSTCHFHESQFSDCHTLCKGISDFVPVLFTFVDQICESRCSASHTLFKGINEMRFQNFSSDLGNIFKGDAQKFYL